MKAAMFSKRTSWDLTVEPLTSAVRIARTRSQRIVDLTVSNPTACSFHYSPGEILGPLSEEGALRYEPAPMGTVAARRAVCDYYADHKAWVNPEQVLLTTSTSEAYSFLFRLLCDPGDEVLVAQPSYPLFDFIATLDHVVLRPFPLFFDYGWWIDFAELERQINARTRAVLLVHPNNPTGHATSHAERRKLEELCASRGLALIVDEVFLDYSLGEPIASFTTGNHGCLKFIVSGISKIAALPQMKVSWLVVKGPESICRQALERLEFIADTFLSMNAPAQHALPGWLAGRATIQRQILARVRSNLESLRQLATVNLFPVDAGWSAILRLPQRLQGEDLAERILLEAGVLVQPGAFYALPSTNIVVISLLIENEHFATGVRMLDQWCESRD